MSAPNAPTISRHGVRWTVVQAVAFGVGLVFLLAGVLGFIPGVTTNYDALGWAGHHSGAKLLGVFAVSVLHNVVHLGFGVAGVILARWYDGARGFLLVGGVVYAALWVYGALLDHHSDANVLPVNAADNWLHLGLAALMLLMAWAFGRSGPRARPMGSLSTGVLVRKA